MMKILLICVYLFPSSITNYTPEGTLQYYEWERIKQLKEHATRMYIINANINYLQ